MSILDKNQQESSENETNVSTNASAAVASPTPVDVTVTAAHEHSNSKEFVGSSDSSSTDNNSDFAECEEVSRYPTILVTFFLFCKQNQVFMLFFFLFVCL